MQIAGLSVPQNNAVYSILYSLCYECRIFAVYQLTEQRRCLL